MAQQRSKRNRRPTRTAVAPSQPTAFAAARAARLKRVVIAFLIIIALGGALAVSSGNGDGTGAPRPWSPVQMAR